jgi:hypothetical protein
MRAGTGSVIGTDSAAANRNVLPSVGSQTGHFATLLFMNVQEFIGTCPTDRRWSYGGQRALLVLWVFSKATRQRKGCYGPLIWMRQRERIEKL